MIHMCQKEFNACGEPTWKVWFGDLRTLTLPPLPSAPTAINSPLIEAFGVTDSFFCPRLHHLPKYRLVPSGPSKPPEKQISPGNREEIVYYSSSTKSAFRMEPFKQLAAYLDLKVVVEIDFLFEY